MKTNVFQSLLAKVVLALLLFAGASGTAIAQSLSVYMDELTLKAGETKTATVYVSSDFDIRDMEFKVRSQGYSSISGFKTLLPTHSFATNQIDNNTTKVLVASISGEIISADNAIKAFTFDVTAADNADDAGINIEAIVTDTNANTHSCTYDNRPEESPHQTGSIWKCYYTHFESDVQAYLTVRDLNGKILEDLYSYELGAFVGDECRGIATEVYNTTGTPGFNIRIWTNDSISNVEFRLYNRSTGEVVSLRNFVDMTADRIGNIDNPEILDMPLVYRLLVFNTGDELISDSILVSSPIVAPSNPTKEGHTFQGWNDIIPATMPNRDLTFDAVWKANEYTLNYYVVNMMGERNDTIKYRTYKYEYGQELSDTLADLTAVGYDYTPWGRTEQSNMGAADINIYCVRTIKSHTIKFVVDDTAIQETIQEYGTQITMPAAPTKVGHVFLGWSPVVEATVPDTDVTYVAQWKANEYLINFVKPNGQLIESTIYAYGSTIVPPSEDVMAKEGYHFAGWMPEFNPTATDKATYIAIYEANLYKVTFQDKDGEAIMTSDMEYGTVIPSTPQAPEVEGWTFAGWSPEFIPGVTEVPANDIVFTATYKHSPYSVTYMVDDVVYYSQLIDEGEPISKITAPSKEGHTFAGWEGLPETMPSENIIIIGNFTRNSYNVTFNWGNESETFSVLYGDPINAPIPQMEGHTFAGWNVAVEATMPNYDLSYTAVFTKNTYNVTFYDYDGKTVLLSTQVAYGDKINAPVSVERKGYTFKGWNTDVEDTMPAHDLTYVATYSIKLYKFTYIVDGEEFLSNEYLYGRALTLIPYLTKQGFNFSGWTYDNPSENESSTIPQTMPDHDVRIVGSFTQKQNTFEFNGIIYALVDLANLRVEVVGLVQQTNAHKRNAVGENENSLVIPAMAFNPVFGKDFTVYSIAAKAFENSNVTSVSIPNTVMEIETEALNIPSLQTISFEGEKLPEFHANAISTDVIIDMPNVDVAVAQAMISEAKNALETKNLEIIGIESKAHESDTELTSKTFTVVATSKMEGANIKGSGVYNFGDVAVLSANSIDGYTMQWLIDDEVVMTGDTYTNSDARDLNIELRYVAKTYTISFKIDDEVIQSYEVEYGSSLKDIILPKANEIAGYTFQNWSTIPETMPSHDLVITGSYKVNSYVVSFVVDGNIVASKISVYGSTIYAPVLQKTGYTIQWTDDIPETVPANDVTINGESIANIYVITYMYNNEVIKTQEVTFDSDIPSFEYTPENDDRYTYTFEGWETEEGTPFTLKQMTVAKDLTLIAKVTVADCISAINVDKSSEVYSIYGVKVTTDSLVPGVYIINGKKTFVRK